MKEQDKIPTSRLSRTGSFIKTGAKVGGNYLKYYSKKLVGEGSEEELHNDNATDIYDSLSKLKGGALKVAQMMSMDEGILPQAFSQKFTQAQYSAPPLSYPLVVKTFRSQLGKSPGEIFESFTKSAVAAASIGQVHEGIKEGSKYAVKVQYPGVADSISSDLKIIRPIVSSMFKISSAELDYYLEEIEERLIEETDYELELKRSEEISAACAHIPGIVFPKYYEEFSGQRILTMDWMDGKHLNEFMETNPSQEVRNRIGQSLWDFYDYQIHEMKRVHADPHPGNFLFRADGTMAVIDFGCIKEFSDAFYENYFRLIEPNIAREGERFEKLLFELNFLLKDDSPEEVKHFAKIYSEMHQLLCVPFFSEEFDFASDDYFSEIYSMSERVSKDKTLRKAKAARGPRDSIYLTRTYFGLYSLLHKLGAKIKTPSAVHELFA
jgi:predicted unusual protein kinase regulating ubiquinone biosynthesis (AarF/ABC1/UbiB family)